MGLFLLSLASLVALADTPTPPAGLTVVSESAAETLFQEVATDPEIPFDYPDGCFAKAEKADIFLGQNGVIAGKAFVEGQLYHSSHWGESYWTFHVAPLILVQEPGGARPYVIDPFLSDKLVRYEDWISLITADPSTSISQTYFTSRFVYGTSEKNLGMNQYNPDDLKDMETVLQQIRDYLAGYAAPPNAPHP